MATAKIAIQYDALDPNGRVFCRRQCLSIATFPNLLWLAMAIDRHALQSIVAGKCHRWTWVTIYCGWQWSSMDTLHVVDNMYNIYIYRLTVPPVYCRRQYLSIYFSPRLLSQTVSIDRFVPRPLSTTSIDGDLPQSIAADNI